MHRFTRFILLLLCFVVTDVARCVSWRNFIVCFLALHCDHLWQDAQNVNPDLDAGKADSGFMHLRTLYTFLQIQKSFALETSVIICSLVHTTIRWLHCFWHCVHTNIQTVLLYMHGRYFWFSFWYQFTLCHDLHSWHCCVSALHSLAANSLHSRQHRQWSTATHFLIS